ncbi:tetratricopeptide repeat protein [Algivirga pacifica]|uniref:tetratricopeptide repeat protein n=1 Tax=Algivirga pacifica TaxID=1162670 RepID=UPI0031E91630
MKNRGLKILLLLCLWGIAFSAWGQKMEETSSLLKRKQHLKVALQSSLDLNNYEQAIRLQRRVLALTSSEEEDYVQEVYNTGLLYEEWGVYKDAITYYQQVLAQALPTSPLWQESQVKLAECYFSLNEWERSLEVYEQVLERSMAQQNTGETSYSLGAIARLNELMGDFEQALQFHLKRYQLDDDNATLGLIEKASRANNLGYAYQRVHQAEQAAYYLNEAIRLKEQAGVKQEMLTALINLGVVYNGDKKLSQAQEVFERAHDLTLEQGRKEQEVIVLSYLAKLYQNQGKEEKSLKIWEEVLEKGDEESQLLRPNMAQAHQELGQLFSKYGMYREANTQYNAAHELEKVMIGDRYGERLDSLKKVVAANTIDKELKLLQIEKEIKQLELKQQQLEDTNKEQQILLLQQQKAKEQLEKERAWQLVETERNLSQIRGLEHAKALLALANKKKEQEAKQQAEIFARENQLKAERNRVQRLELEDIRQRQKLILFGTLLLFVVTAGILYAFFHIRKKNAQLRISKQQLTENAVTLTAMNERLQYNSEVIENKNQEIYSSLQYAQRIQTAMLPSLEAIREHIPELFVFYKPYDLVGGDFYWFWYEDRKSFLAVADCTGHGVPGAFLSMIGHKLLQEIVVEKKNHRPSEILSLLHEGMMKALRQQDTGNNDGMDISLVVIDHKARELQFAGAHHSMLYLVEGKEMNHLKGNRRAIGGSIYQKEGMSEDLFTTHTLPMEGIATIYLYTDGFQDQFSPAGKKYMNKRFRDFLKSIHHRRIFDQEELVEREFENWKGTLERQTDDVLVVGFRIM